MFTVNLILWILAFTTIISCECTESDIEVLDICYNEYFESFNFSYSSPDDYSKRMQGLLKSMEGVDEICDRYKTLQNCLGNDVIVNCTNTAAFSKTNFSMGNPKGMISNYFIFKFQCGRGYEILKTDFDCLSSFPNGCYYDLDTCNQWYDMIHCISKSAQKECSDEAGYYMFETLNIEECYMRPDCKQLEFKGSYFFSRSGSFFPTLEGKMKCIYPMLYGIFYNLSFLPIPLQCIYRYFCIYRNTQLPKWIIISIYLGILTLLIPGGYYYVIVFDPIEKDPGGYAIIKSLPFWENANGIERFCVTELSSPGVYVYCLLLNIIAICGLITIFYTSHKCYYFLKSHLSIMSTKNLRMHSELGQRLILQGMLPLFYAINTILLCSAIYIFPNFGGGLYLYIFLPYPWQAVINCIVTMASIRSYRNTLLSWLHCLNNTNKISINNSANIAVISPPEIGRSI